MRWLFLLLLVLNIVYVAWELNRERAQPSARAVLPEGVDTIVLLSELASEPAEDKQIAKADTAGPAQPDATDSSRSEPGDSQQARASASASPPESRPQTLATPAPSARKSAAAVDAKRVTETDTEPAGDRCFTVGPFNDMQTLRRVTREIKDYVVEASFRSKEEQEQTMFRVLIKPLGSKEEARALIEDLEGKNIREHFIITEGAYKNAVSLGYFSSKDRAYRYANRVRRLGFDAEAEPVFRSYTIYWLDYRIGAGNDIPRQVLDKHLDNATQRLRRACG